MEDGKKARRTPFKLCPHSSNGFHGMLGHLPSTTARTPCKRGRAEGSVEAGRARTDSRQRETTHLSCSAGRHQDEHGANVGRCCGERVGSCRRAGSSASGGCTRGRGRARRTRAEAHPSLLERGRVDMVKPGAHGRHDLERRSSCAHGGDLVSLSALSRGERGEVGEEGAPASRSSPSICDKGGCRRVSVGLEEV